MHRVLFLLSLIVLSAGTLAQTKSGQPGAPQAPPSPAPSHSATAVDSSSRLPVKRIVLYKNGVGYFEHTARVHNTQDLSIDFTTAQLNDVLKSLTAVDLGAGKVSSVRYNSIAPLDERLKSLRLPFGEEVTQSEYLSALRGARIEVRSGSTNVSGRLLSVEKIRRRAKDDFEDITSFSVVTDSGDMRNFDLLPGTSVRIAERELTEEVGRYLSLIGSSRARDVRRMSFTASGTGDRDVFVSYISEVPVWKSTYRILLPEKPKEKPLLQGWAIVDNTIGEDWKDVQLSLVAGAPQSFIQQISQPFYTRRPVIALPDSVMLTPQSHEATLQQYDRLEQYAKLEPLAAAVSHATTSLYGFVKDPTGAVVPGARVTIRNEETGASQVATTDSRGRYQFNDIQAGNSALFVTGAGFQRFNLANIYLGIGRNNEIDATLNVAQASETVEVQGTAPVVNTESAMVSTIEKQGTEAEGKSAGDFFEYKINQKITIGKNQSALVPILQAHIDAEKVTLWNPGSAPLRALWIKNTSGQVLDSGSFNVLEADSFAGEGVMETIHPDERRLLSYAGDSAVHIKYTSESSDTPFSHIRIAKGVMVLTKEERRSNKFTIRNADTEPRQVIVEYPAEAEWQLAPGSPKPEESTESFHRFRVPVEGGKSAELTVDSFHPDETRYELTNLDDEEVSLLLEQKRETPAMQQAFERILKQKEKVNQISGEIANRKHESDQIASDQARIRENMKALKGSSEEKSLLQRYVGQLDSQESRLAILRKESADLASQEDAAKSELDRTIMQVTLDETF